MERPRHNIAARMGRWSASHRKTAIFGWLAFVVLAVVIGGSLPKTELTNAESLTGEPAQAQRILDASGIKEPRSEIVFIQRGADVPQAAATDAVKAVVARLEATPNVEKIVSPLTPGLDGLVSKDGRSMLVNFAIAGDPEKAKDKIAPIMAAVESVAGEHPAVSVREFGITSAGKQLDQAISQDMKRAEMLSIPITLAVLLLTFGALVAAVLPLAFALTAFVGAVGLLGFTSQVLHVNSSAQTVMLLIGLAVGVDYSLFYLKRDREERARGTDPRRALEVAAATSGRSVLISGITVVIAMAGMFLTGHPIFSGMGMATILVVLTAMLGSLTVLPALMSWLGTRVDKGRIPFVGRLSRSDGEGRIWSAVLTVVLRRPVVWLLVSGLALVALALPALGMQLRNEGIEDLPKSLPVMQTYERINATFPGGSDPAQVVVKADDVRSPRMQRALAELRTRALATGKMNEPIDVRFNPDNTVAVVSVPLVGDGEDAASVEALRVLRQDVVPGTVGAVDGATAKVGGGTANSVAFRDLIMERTPWVFAFVLAFAFVLLLVSFRSLVVAVKAIVLNLLSVAASYGAVVLVFQHGWGMKLVGVEQTGAIINWLPLFLFVILFGLSMDYHVFILSRIREGFESGRSTTDAIAHGIKSSAGVVTSAAIIMVFVFLTFVTLSLTSMKQVGLGLAIAVLLDATVVRAILLPATMKLLGDANWYLPRWLNWLPRLEHEAQPVPVPVSPAGDDLVGAGQAGPGTRLG
ncbi:MMPL family transporter [Planosporangium sp. 12N6]|uniref:MMPL family transporter n=1 Tax=Planosporangium spinosum TaxID=3402278 RepID=UPI003CE859AC